MTKTIHTPSITNIDETGNSATFTVEPLLAGYGMTLGNSIRRVLLTSISGAAVTAFKVKGASHEFTTLPGVKEDVVQIMLNLKGLRFKVFSDEPQTITLSKKGAGPVKAADISGNADVEVVNKDHLIATLDSAKDSIEIELVVETGRGYQSVEESTARKASDMIALDAIFSPVLRVRYHVENTRVGQMTNLDKLMVTVDTDATITPKDAFEEASAILASQYQALAGQTEVASESFASKSEESHVETSSEDPEELLVSIEDLNFSARTTNALINNDIHTLKDLFTLSEIELKELKGFGSKALDEVKDKLAEMEL
ncbi:DNA-directed RNA polymerase subunit alpha [Candidatus Saccharibacteria bacterium]|nr:DNA-directed RNA polymerase subunit alpha [Candidatus Saccharibacteria bacterium]MCB9821533.1 DNA-directed RNA polymerase subunit alpha [Candidatus Nomurabacteria bacterium]